MGHELDFLPVGELSKGGDAIALRFGNLHGSREEQTVIIIDGGHASSGTALVEHVKTHFGTDYVDWVVSTHPDRDHIKGLETVLEELEVGTLLMHLPEEHDQVMKAAALSGTKAVLGAQVAKSLEDTESLVAIANRQGVEIVEPFAGMATPDGSIRILGPSEDYYEEKLAEMRGQSITASGGSLLGQLVAKAKSVVLSLIPETIWVETLAEDGTTTPSNNSSTIVLITAEDRQLLFTGDAGNEALDHALQILESEGFEPGSLNFVQIPHHGSRHNVSPSILDRLLGEKGQTDVGTAYVSCPVENPDKKHPAKKTTNAFHRRGYTVHATAGMGKRHHHNAPARPGWSTAVPLPFYDQVEEHG